MPSALPWPASHINYYSSPPLFAPTTFFAVLQTCWTCFYLRTFALALSQSEMPPSTRHLHGLLPYILQLSLVIETCPTMLFLFVIIPFSPHFSLFALFFKSFYHLLIFYITYLLIMVILCLLSVECNFHMHREFFTCFDLRTGHGT